MNKYWGCLLVVVFVNSPIPLFGQTDNSGSATDTQAQIQKLQDELNQLELQTESLQSKTSQVQKPVLGFDGAILEQDFESNSASWSILEGQTLQLKFLADPMPGTTGHFDLEFWGRVAPDILHYSYLPTLASENIFFALREADVTFDASVLSFKAFTGLAHDGFQNSYDDLYYLYPPQQDVETPWRVSGRPVPTGMEIKGEKDLDGLDIWAGQELNWGAGQELFVAYKHNIGATTLGVIDRVQLQQIDAYAQGVTYAPAVTVTSYMTAPTNATEAFWKIPAGDLFTLDAVVLYNPANANQTYTYVQNVAPGTGTLGTSYLVYQGTTNNTGDALGYQAKITTHSIPFLDSVMVNGEYSGIIANDLERISGEITEVPAPYCLFTFDATAQKPLIGPNPLVYYGTQGNALGALVEPRGQYDPFQIMQNPISGINNRQMTKFSLSFVFNNGNGWFFKYNPNAFDSYNINMDLDTAFSTGIIGTLFDYPTSTDLTNFILANGTLAWEAPGSLGQPATDGYLPFVHWVTMWRTGQLHWVADLQGGYSMALLGQSTAYRSSTDLFQANLTLRINNTSLTAGYGQDVWGPEYWDQQFGDTIGQLFLAQITQKFGLSQVSLKYERWGNLSGDPYQYDIPGINSAGQPYPYLISGINFPINELYATYTLSF